eukprot:g18526.t1
MWSIASAAPDVTSSTLVRPSGGWETTLWNTCTQFVTNDNTFQSRTTSTPPSYSLNDMSILGLLQCHIDATRKLEEQHLIFCLGSLQPN